MLLAGCGEEERIQEGAFITSSYLLGSGHLAANFLVEDL